MSKTKAELLERIKELENYDVFDRARDIRKSYGNEEAVIFIIKDSIQVGLEKDFFSND